MRIIDPEFDWFLNRIDPSGYSDIIMEVFFSIEILWICKLFFKFVGFLNSVKPVCRAPPFSVRITVANNIPRLLYNFTHKGSIAKVDEYILPKPR